MASDRLSPLDTSFLEVESSSAHMHVGWAAAFALPPDGSPPRFEQVRNRVADRLGRSPRFRQKLAPVPFGVNRPLWVDDESFRVERHVRPGRGPSLTELAGQVLSTPLSRERPLWEIWVADRLDDGRIGLVGKAHHCMVDGIAAVELASLLLDPTPEPAPESQPEWKPDPPPDAVERLAGSIRGKARSQVELARLAGHVARSPQRLLR